MTILKVSDLRVYYDRIPAIHGISFSVEEKEIVAIIGANGAGKTTTLLAIMGSAAIGAGTQVVFQGKDIARLPAHRIAREGIGFVPEGRRLFPQMTVMENLEMGSCFTRMRKDFSNSLEFVFSIFPRLKERRNQLAGTLSGGEQQMVAVGRALMSKPRLLLLDEPSLGLAPMMVSAIFRVIAEINRQGTAILLVEQNARMALRLCDRAFILETGRITTEGAGRDLLDDDSVRRAYLGRDLERPHGNDLDSTRKAGGHNG